MDDYVVWFVIGFGLVIAELLTGTFYLLVPSRSAQPAWWRFSVRQSCCNSRRRRRSASVERYGCASRALDGACAIERPAIACRTWMLARRCGSTNGRRTAQRAQTTEATWDVELAPGEEPASGEFVIREINANRLIVAAKPR